MEITKNETGYFAVVGTECRSFEKLTDAVRWAESIFEGRSEHGRSGMDKDTD